MIASVAETGESNVSGRCDKGVTNKCYQRGERDVGALLGY